MVEQRTSTGFDLTGLDLSVDRGYELPLGIQLAWKLRALIASRRIAPGDRMPSVRELATHAGVNVNTVRTVYSRLENDGFVVSRQGTGTFAADPAPAATDVERMASAAIADARAEGLDPRDLATAIYAAAAPDTEIPEGDPDRDRFDDDDLPPGGAGALPDPDQDSDQAPVRRELRRQIEKLEVSLGAYPDSLRPTGEVHPRFGPQAHVAAVGELEQSRNQLVDRIAEFGALAEHRAIEQELSRQHLERMVEAPDAHKWERVDNERIGEPGCRHWHSTPRFSFLGMLMGWWQVKVSSGCPLAEPRRRRLPAARQRRDHGQIGSRQGIPTSQIPVRAGRRHDGPDREDGGFGDPSSVPLRR